MSWTVLAMQPTTSKVLETLQIPDISTVPLVGFIPYKADLEAGVTTEPSASVPIASGLYPTETPTAEPDEEPPGDCR